MGKTIEEQRDEIRNGKKELKLKGMPVDRYLVRGIYFLYMNNKIVYIGQSKDNVFRRICDHYSECVKEFNSFSFKKYDVSDKQLTKIELSYIRRHKPRYNVIGKKHKK